MAMTGRRFRLGLLGRPGFRRIAVFLGLVLVILAPVTILLHRPLLTGAIFTPADLVYEAYSPWRDLHPEGYRSRNALLADQVTCHYPWAMETVRRVRAGDVPIWNPLAGAGTPLLANQGSAVLAPWSFLWFLTSPARAQGLLAAATLACAALGMLLWLRSVRVSPGPAAIGALAFSLSGPMVVWLGFPQARAAALLPLALYFAEQTVHRRALPWAGGLGLVLASVGLAGHLETSWHVALVVLLYGLVRIAGLVARKQRGPATKALGLCLMAGAVGVGLSAPYVWPAVAHILETPLEPSSAFLPIKAAVTTILPGAFGLPTPGPSPFQGPFNYNEICAYIGLVPLFFAIRGLTLRGPDRTLCGTLLGFLILAVAGAFAGWSFFQWAIPAGLRPILFHGRLLLIAAWALSALAALGLQNLLAPRSPSESESVGPRTARVRATVAVGLGLGLLALAAAWIGLVSAHPTLTFRQLPSDPRALHLLRQLLVAAGFLGATVLLTTLFQRRVLTRLFFVGSVVVVTAADLLITHHDFHPSLPASRFQALWAEAEPPATLANQIPPARFVGYDHTLPPNLGQVYGLNDVRVYDPLTPPAYRELWQAGVVDPGNRSRTLTVDSPFHDLLGVRHVFSYRPLGGAVGAVVGAAPPAPRSVTVDLRSARAGGRAALFTRLEDGGRVLQDTPVARVVFRTRLGETRSTTLHAGVETAAGFPPEAGEARLHRAPPATLERWVRVPNLARQLQQVFATVVDLRDLKGELEAMEVTYLADQGRLVLERFSPGTERPDTAWGREGGKLRLLALKPYLVYENTRALPRAWIAHRSEVIDAPTDCLDRLFCPSFDRAGTIILEAPFDFGTLPPVPLETAGESDLHEQVKITRYASSVVELEAVLDSSGFVVLSDLFDPGWKATVQGRDWPILRVDHALRAIPLPRGGTPEQPFRIRLNYDPPGYRPGLWCALVAGLLLLVLFLHPWVTAHRAPAAREGRLP